MHCTNQLHQTFFPFLPLVSLKKICESDLCTLSTSQQNFFTFSPKELSEILREAQYCAIRKILNDDN
jgi:hypothetical protein